MAGAAYFPLGLYTAGRQAQIYVERFLGSGLDAGTISQLNYASKIAQISVVLVTTVIVNAALVCVRTLRSPTPPPTTETPYVASRLDTPAVEMVGGRE